MEWILVHHDVCVMVIHSSMQIISKEMTKI